MAGIPAAHRNDFARLQQVTASLHSLMASGEFHTLPRRDRRRLLRQVKRLYNRLAGPRAPGVARAAVAAVGLLTLAGCPGPVSPNVPQDGTGDDATDTGGGSGGTPLSPSFGTYQANPFSLDSTVQSITDLNATGSITNDGSRGPMVLADLDADGDLDLISLEIRRESVTNAPFRESYLTLQARTSASSFDTKDDTTLDALNSGALSGYNGYGGFERDNLVLAAGDLDGDGDLDLITSFWSSTGQYSPPDGPYLGFVENTGTDESAVFSSHQQVSGASTYTDAVSLADIDADGDLDIVGMNSAGVFFAHPNTSTGGSISFAAGESAPYGLSNVEANFYDYGRTTQGFELADVDLDGDLDLMVTGYDGTSGDGVLFFYENQGGSPPAFGTGQSTPFGMTLPVVNWYDSTSSFDAPFALETADMDGDGDYDLLLGPSVRSESEQISPLETEVSVYTEYFYVENTTIQ